VTRLVLTGTDTGVGKTVVAAAVVGLTGARYWKPVQAGLEDETDTELVARLSRQETIPEAYRLTTPCSPHQAAAIDGVTIDPDRLTPPPGPLIVEGAGGVLVPLTETVVYADLFARWRLPVVLVARTELGTINHSLLSLEALRTRGVEVAGIAFVGDANAETERIIGKLGKVGRIGRLPWLEPLSAETLSAAAASGLDLRGLAR
jgi:dethiobiotin synthetase